jgi:signal transduction histidine kinase
MPDVDKIIKVLVVEDDEDDFILTRDLLAEIDPRRFAPEWISSYDAALDRIGGNGFDVCLLDFRLGQHNGLDLLREALKRGASAPIILLTGQGDRETDIEATKAGAADFLVKGQLSSAVLERSIRYAIQQKQMEEERIQRIRDQEARKQAEAANLSKDEFLAMVSHELRTPLNSMLGWVSILRGAPGDEQVRTRAVEAIERAARAQNRLVDDLLDITRVGNGSLWIEKQPVAIGSVIERAAEEAFPAARGRSVTLETSIGGEAAIVEGDPARLQQVFNNLISNAIKFTPPGGRVAVALRHDGNSVVVTVEDNGLGISPAHLPHIFERYHHARDSATNPGGLGLGLAIAHHIVELHGGRITAESEGENRGSTFTVRLPLSAA